MKVKDITRERKDEKQSRNEQNQSSSTFYLGLSDLSQIQRSFLHFPHKQAWPPSVALQSTRLETTRGIRHHSLFIIRESVLVWVMQIGQRDASFYLFVGVRRSTDCEDWEENRNWAVRRPEMGTKG